MDAHKIILISIRYTKNDIIILIFSFRLILTFRRVRREVVDCMRLLMKLAKEKQGAGMFYLVESMLKKTKVMIYIKAWESFGGKIVVLRAK